VHQVGKPTAPLLQQQGAHIVNAEVWARLLWLAACSHSEVAGNGRMYTSVWSHRVDCADVLQVADTSAAIPLHTAIAATLMAVGYPIPSTITTSCVRSCSHADSVTHL
jgi:hypothetical protein